MKRALSLLLTFAMVMSLFTTAAFAAGSPSEPQPAAGMITGVTFKDGTAEYPVRYAGSTATVYYADAAPALNESKFAVAPATTTVQSYSDNQLNVKAADNNNYYVAVVTKQIAVKLIAPASSTTLRVDDTAKKLYYTGATVSLSGLTAQVMEKESSLVLADLTAIPEISGTDIKAKFYKGGVACFGGVAFDTGYDLALDTAIVFNRTNGGYVTASEVLSAVKARLNVSSLASLSLTLSATNGLQNGIGVYRPSSTTPLNNTTVDVVATPNVTINTTAGTIGSRVINYNADGAVGTITINSNYADPITVSQVAPFAKEEFRVDYITGIASLRDASGVLHGYSNSYYGYNGILISSGTISANYIGYTASNVAQQVTVNFTYPTHDMVAYSVADGDTPFDAEAFETFAAGVVAEQLGTSTYSGALEKVSIYNYSALNQYTLYLGSSKLTSTAITPAQLDTVTMDVLKTGAYSIGFTAYYKYYVSGVSYNTSAVSGTVLVYAGDSGELEYEVEYGDTVTFDVSDFKTLYKEVAGKTKNLNYVVVNKLPSYGALYTAPNRISNTYKVSVGDTFYVSPKSAQKDLADLTYVAASTYTKDYSDYVYVTMHGTGVDVSITMKINIIDEEMPFVDVLKGSTFYEYIRYCYNHGIMGGKSAIRFDATSSITRVQLVTTLYRMAGSPTTYNSRTLPFTDTKNLSTEFSNAVKWAYYNKIVGGTSATTFAPNTAVTRQAMVKILYGYAKAYGMDTALEYNNHIGYYTDGGNVSASMKDAMNWALDYGLLSGNSSNKLNPRGSTSRGAAAKILANFHESFIG